MPINNKDFLRVRAIAGGGSGGSGGGGDAVTAGIIYDEVDADGNPVKVTVRCKSLPKYALADNKTVTDVFLSNDVQAIGEYAFQNASIEELNIPNTVQSLGEYMAYGCSNLTSVHLPEYLTGRLSNYMFYSCTKLSDIIIPKGITAIGQYAFDKCTELLDVILPDGLVEIGRSAFSGNRKMTTTFHDGLVSIGIRAFSECDAMISQGLIIPASVKTIENYAFVKNNSNSSDGVLVITFKGTPTSISASGFQVQQGGGVVFNVPWAEGEVANAPWGATNATINYNYTGE